MGTFFIYFDFGSRRSREVLLKVEADFLIGCRRKLIIIISRKLIDFARDM